jgi:sodium-dependent phosphate cotransporter
MDNWKQRLGGPAKALAFVLALNVFFVAIKLLGAFKGIGSGMGETMMAELATRPMVGLLLGVLVTSIIQSSSTTTSLVVGLAASGVFGNDPATAMQAAVPLVMGANIGTTVTNTIVSFGHIGDNREFRRAFAAATVHDVFNLMTVAILLPLQIMTNFIGLAAVSAAEFLRDIGGLKVASPLKLLVDPQAKAVAALFNHEALVDFTVILALVVGALTGLGYLERRQRNGSTSVLPVVAVACFMSIVGLGVKLYHPIIFSKPTAVFLAGLALLLGTLALMVTIMRSVVLARVQRVFRTHVFKTTLRAMALGMVLTALVQSSSVTTSLIVPLAGAGLVTLSQVFPFALGANLGTTVTALMAALSLGEPVALAVALAHLLFNLCGIITLYPLRRIPLAASRFLAEMAARWHIVPVIYVLGLYVLLPLTLIWLFKG